MPPDDPLTAPVGIVGGGPVGMMLALFLERHGVPAVLFNVEPDSRFHPKGNTHNSRTMEHYRRLGLAPTVRALGLPADHPTDVAYFTRYGGFELARLRMPSEAERMARVAASPRTDQVPEPIHRANQMYVEKAVFDRIGESRVITRRYGWRVVAMQEERDDVAITAENAADGAREAWRFRYVIGCDGGQGFVRRALGIRYEGYENLQQKFMGGRMIANWLRLPDFIGGVVSPERRAWQYTLINPGRRMVLVNLNGKGDYLLFTPAPDPGSMPDAAAVRRTVDEAVGRPVATEVLNHIPWTAGVALFTERFGSGGRVVLAGDAAHLFTPTGGFGFNTGIDDAANLSWKLAALVQGWGGPELLATYEPERRPIAIRNVSEARRLAIQIGEMPAAPELEEESAAGGAARKTLGDFLSSKLGEEFASLGIQLGARYDGSRIVVEDGAPPADDPIVYRPSSVPGGRAPHLWLDDGRGIGSSLFDHLGVGFTLLSLGRAPTAALEAAARQRGVPLAVRHLDGDDARALYERDLVLIRPDQHVCWRGNDLPADCDRLLARVTGYP